MGPALAGRRVPGGEGEVSIGEVGEHGPSNYSGRDPKHLDCETCMYICTNVSFIEREGN